MNDILNIRGLKKTFSGREVLRGVDLELEADGITVLLGSNGAGKSTLLRCVLGLLKPSAGEVAVLGWSPLKHARKVRQGIGYVPDQADAYGWMTADDLFRFLRPQYPEWSEEREGRLCQRLNAPRKARFDAMSRGEAAKVMLAAALIPSPKLLLCDEPFARLAPPVREEVLSAFVEETPLPGGAVLLATHDLEVAARVADRVLVIDEGRIVHDCKVEELIAEHEGEPARLTASLRALYPEEREETPVR